MLDRWRIVAVNIPFYIDWSFGSTRWDGRMKVWFLASSHYRVGEHPSQFCLSRQTFTWVIVTKLLIGNVLAD